MSTKKLLHNAKVELSKALDLIVELSCCPKSEVLGFSKVQGIKETLDNLSEIDLENNKYFGRNLLGKNYHKDFDFKEAKEYENLREWPDNVYIVQNENISLKTEINDRISIMDKRSGISYSTMGEYISIESINEMKCSEEKAEEYLIIYFFKKNKNLLH